MSLNGMGLLFKSMGIDPEQIANVGKEMGERLVALENSLDNINTKLDRLLEGKPSLYQLEKKEKGSNG